jgi:hypothetical protein
MADLYDKPSEKGSATHEAAHAIAHLALNLPGKLEYIHIDNRPPHWSGHTEINRPASSEPTAPQGLDCVKQCLVGAQAEMRVDNDWPIAESGAQDDYEKAKRYAAYFGIDEDLASWEHAACRLVDERWQAIETVADALMHQRLIDCKKTLCASEVGRLMREAGEAT